MSRRHTCKPGLYVTAAVFAGPARRVRVQVSDSLTSPHLFMLRPGYQGCCRPGLSVCVQTVAADSHPSTSYGSGRTSFFEEVTDREGVRAVLLRALDMARTHARLGELPAEWSRYLATPFVVCLACQRKTTP